MRPSCVSDVRHHERGHSASERTRVRLGAEGPEGPGRVLTWKLDVKLSDPGTHATAAAGLSHGGEVGARQEDRAGRFHLPLPDVAKVKHSKFKLIRWPKAKS